MEYDVQVNIAKIVDNPFQPRTTDNAEHIENLARSIAVDGLLQVPTARQMDDGTYQLAFGHSRRKAFEWLRDMWKAEGLPNKYNGYNDVPLNVEELNDEEMYRYAVTENVQRKDLDPIETARAMSVYRDKFGKSSKEIGELFGMNDATVRGKMALLRLPDAVQVKLSEGAISEGTARLLNSLNKVLPDKVQDALDDILGNGSEEEYEKDIPNPADVVDSILNDSKKIVELRIYNTPWRDEKKFPNKHLAPMTFPQFVKIANLNVDMDYVRGAWMKRFDLISKGEKIDDLVYGNAETEKEQAALLAHLIDPSNCSACDYSVTVDGSRYCGIKACWERKNQAWKLSILTKASKSLGIAIYDPKTDGEDFIILSRWEARHVKLIKEKDASLRLASGNGYNSQEGVPDGVTAIQVGKAAEKAIAKQKKEKEEQTSQPKYGSDEYKAREEKRNAHEILISRFAWEVAVPLIQPMVGIAHLNILECLMEQVDESNEYPADVADLESLSGKARVDALQKRLAFSLLYHGLDWSDKVAMFDSDTPVTRFAKWAHGVLVTWGAKLPKTWLDTAQDYEPVSVETEVKKGKK